MDNENWTRVYTTNKMWQSDMIKQIFEAEGIKTEILNKQDSSYYFGDIEIYVSPSDIDRAKELLKTFES